MRVVMQIDFTTSVAAVLELGKPAFENDLTRLYLELGAKGVWSKDKSSGRVDFLLCEDLKPRDLTAVAKRVYETTLVRPILFPEKVPDQSFGF